MIKRFIDRFFKIKQPWPDYKSLSVIAALAEQLNKEKNAAKRARSILDTMPRPLWLSDAKNGMITWCNDAYASALDLSKEQVIEEQKYLSPSIVYGSGDVSKNCHSRITIINAGKRKVMDISCFELPSSNLILGVALDVSREDEMARSAQQNQSVYHELLENLRSAIGIYDSQQRLVFYNTAFAQLWDLPEKWLNTRPSLSDVMDKLRETRRLPEQADFGRFKAAWLAMFTDLIDPHDDMFHLPDGSSFRVLVIANPAGGLMMVFEDVTSRLELESSYNTLIAVQRETLDALAEGVAVFGGDGRLKLWNPSFAKLWGLHPEALHLNPHISQIAKKMGERLPFGSRKQGKAAIHSMAIDRKQHKGQFLCAQIGDEKGSIHIAYSSLPLPDGGVMVTFRDISDTQRIEQALEDKAKALEAAEALKIDFLANVSYQLRTPLNTMMGFADILGQEYFGKLNERQREYTDGVLSAGGDLLQLIDDILDLSTIEAGYMDLHLEMVEIQPMLESLSKLAQGWAYTSKAKIVIDRDLGTKSVWCDEKRIRQAMINLIRNALTYTPEGGKIVLGARASHDTDGGVELFVSDGGVGIDKKDKDRIFKPFERAAEPQGGAGLGLTLVKSIMTLHGGDARIDSAPSKGTSVILSIPAQDGGESKDV